MLTQNLVLAVAAVRTGGDERTQKALWKTKLHDLPLNHPELSNTATLLIMPGPVGKQNGPARASGRSLYPGKGRTHPDLLIRGYCDLSIPPKTTC